MRPVLLAIPSFLALASAAGLLAVALKAKNSESFDVNEVPKHPVTTDMMVKTGAMKTKIATAFTTKDTNGAPIQIAGNGLKRPQFVYFVNNGCPCSYAAEPLFHSLADQFKGQVDFISVTNASAADAKKWIAEMQVTYPVVPDPKVEIMHAYGAISSAYSALITTDGKIYKMWPGFSKDLLLDMNRELAAVIGQPERPFDTQYAPLRPATGCTF